MASASQQQNIDNDDFSSSSYSNSLSRSSPTQVPRIWVNGEENLPFDGSNKMEISSAVKDEENIEQNQDKNGLLLVTGGISLLESDRDSMNSANSKVKKMLKDKASELIIQVPARQLKRIATTQGISSVQRETQHFVGVTSINGLLRIYRSKGVFRLCWILVTTLSVFLLFVQINQLSNLYQQKPTVSQVSFILPENGLPFPAVTICSHNPIRREYIEKLNKTGHFSHRLLDYMLLSFMDIQYLLAVRDPMELRLAEEEWKDFMRYNEPKFSVNGFFWNASSSCQEMLKVCSFGGREFACCKYAKGILTDIGKCYQIYLGDSDEPWLARQVQAGMNNGLQIIADSHTEEQISSMVIGMGHVFADNFENGFRYYVHEQLAMPYLSTEGISVSPGTKVYSAVSPTKYLLLSREDWGNCSMKWPEGMSELVSGLNEENVHYTSLKCKTICRAKYFNELCGCSPYIYNIEEHYKICTPFDMFLCLNSTILNNTASGESANYADFYQFLPPCAQCDIECHRWVYHTYNSYAQGFSRSSLGWLRKRNEEWSPGHVRSNFVSINIFFRDLCYTEYKQVQSVSFTQIFSDIGGNMGLFLGMSMISLLELVAFVFKLSWLFISKKRREHMLAKKQRDEEREQRLQATLEFASNQQKIKFTTTNVDGNVAKEATSFSFPAAIEFLTAADAKDENLEDAREWSIGSGQQTKRMRKSATSANNCRLKSDDGDKKEGKEKEDDENGHTQQRRRQQYVEKERKVSDYQQHQRGVHEQEQGQRPKTSLFQLGVADTGRTNLMTEPHNIRMRSNSVFANLFSSNNNISNSKKSSSSAEQRRDFVESVIQSRLHGDATRVSLSSSSCSSENEEDADGGDNFAVGEERRKRRGKELVEFKINLGAVIGAGKQGECPHDFGKENSAKRRANGTLVEERYSNNGSRRASMSIFPRPSSMEPTQMVTSAASFATTIAACGEHRRLVVPSLLMRQLKPTIEAQKQIATSGTVAGSEGRRQSIAIFPIGSPFSKKINDNLQAQNLCQIARKRGQPQRDVTNILPMVREETNASGV